MITVRQLARELGVTERQLYRDRKFADAVNVVAEKLGLDPMTMLNGELTIPKAYYEKLATLPTDELSKVFQRIRQGERCRDILGSAFPSRLERVQAELCKFNADEWDEFTDWLQAVFRSIGDHEQWGRDE